MVKKYFLINIQHFKPWSFLDYSIYKVVVNSAHFVKSTPLTALSVSFQYFVSMLHNIEHVHEVG